MTEKTDGPDLTEDDAVPVAVPAREATDREPVTVQCPSCQEIMPAGLVACGECGSPLDQKGAASSAAVADVDLEGGPAGIEAATISTVQENAVSGSASELDQLLDVPGTGVAVTPSTRPAGSSTSSRLQGLRGRVVLPMVGAVVVATIVGVVWSASASSSAPAPAGTPRSSTSSTAVSAETVTLPGWVGSPAWSMKDVKSAVASGTRVIGITNAGVSVWNAKSGKTVDTAALAGTGVRVLGGFVGAEAAVAAVSDTQALVWVEGQNAPLNLDVSGGRSLDVRTGSLVVTGPDRAFWLVTAAGEVPLTAPAPQMIVLGADADSVIWASGSQHVVVASPNGAVLSDVTLTPPAEGATVTPRTGWLQAANRAITVVGWTLPEGGKALGVYETGTGQPLIPTLPGESAALLSPDRALLASNEYLISLTDRSAATRFQDGFVPVRWLGGDLYGGLARGGDAIFAPTSGVSSVPAATVRPLAIADGYLLTLTGDRLASFAPKK